MRALTSLLVLLFLTSIQISCSSEKAVEEQTAAREPLKVYLVRHTEKVDQSRDPELSQAGKERALELAKMLRSTGIEYIHSSDYIRTRETANPVAQTLGLTTEIYNPKELDSFAQKLRDKGGVHLVVGHSNSTPSLVDLLGGKSGSKINDAGEYDRLYIISDSGKGFVETTMIRYGDPYYEESEEKGK